MHSIPRRKPGLETDANSLNCSIDAFCNINLLGETFLAFVMDGTDISVALIDCYSEAKGGVGALLEEIERNGWGWTLVWRWFGE